MRSGKFSKLAANLRQWITRGPSSSIGVDIGSGVLKVIEIDWGNNVAVIRSAGMTDLPDNLVQDGRIADREVMSQALCRLLTSTGVTARQVVVSVGGQAVFSRVLSFPAMTAEELRQAVTWDLDKYIPAGAENYYFDFATLSSGKETCKSQVLLVAAPQSMVHDIMAVCRVAGLKLVAVDIGPLALCRAVSGAGNSLVADIGHKMCQITLFQNDCPVVSRIIPLGGVRFTDTIMHALALDYHEAELFKQRWPGVGLPADDSRGLSLVDEQLREIAGQLGREISRTADYYQAQDRAAVIDGIILAGGGARMNELAINLAAQLGSTAVTLIDPLSGFEMSKSLDAAWLQRTAPQLAMAVGLALRGGEGC